MADAKLLHSIWQPLAKAVVSWMQAYLENVLNIAITPLNCLTAGFDSVIAYFLIIRDVYPGNQRYII